MKIRLALLGIALVAMSPCAPAQDDHPPIVPADPNPSDLNRDLYRFIEDDAPVRGRQENGGHEALAYEYTFSFCRNVSLASFHAAARNDVGFAQMMGPDRLKLRGVVVPIAGSLRRLRRFEPPDVLVADGNKDLFEAWIVPDTTAGNPVCVVFGELPAGLTPNETLDVRVHTCAFFFKVYRYGAGDGQRRAPLLIGRTLELPVVPATVGLTSQWSMTGQLLLTVLGGLAAVGVALAALAWWFRRNDRQTMAQLRIARGLPIDGDDDLDRFVAPTPDRVAYDHEPSAN